MVHDVNDTCTFIQGLRLPLHFDLRNKYLESNNFQYATIKYYMQQTVNKAKG